MVNLGRRSRHSGVPDHSRQIATFSTPTTIQGRYGKTRGRLFRYGGEVVVAVKKNAYCPEIFSPSGAWQIAADASISETVSAIRCK